MTAKGLRPGWTRKVPHAPDCPKENIHTLQPTDYGTWHEWAERMQRTHEQIRCPGCDRYAIWVKKAEAPA